MNQESEKEEERRQDRRRIEKHTHRSKLNLNSVINSFNNFEFGSVSALVGDKG